MAEAAASASTTQHNDTSTIAQAKAEGGSDAIDTDGYKTLPDLLPGGFHPYQPVTDAEEGPNIESNRLRPPTDAVLTVRIIKSFEYRSMKALVLPHVDLTTMTVDQLKDMCRKQVATTPAFKPFRNHADKLDTLKIYTRAHGTKTMNLIINLDRPEWVLDEGTQTLVEAGLENEAELSFFQRSDYEAFLANPQTKW